MLIIDSEKKSKKQKYMSKWKHISQGLSVEYPESFLAYRYI